MFGIWRRGSAVVVPAVAMLVLLLAPRQALAEPGEAAKPDTLFGFVGQMAPADAETQTRKDAALESAAPFKWENISLDRVWAEDFHPETDRWTERNNRIKISIYGAGLFFPGNLRIACNAAVGLRIAWEVPGFIGIRLESVCDPLSRMRIRTTNALGGTSLRNMKGFVDCTSLSIAIFNPELSYPANIAMWAGLGWDVWFYHYYENNISFIGQRFDYQDFNVGGNFFFDLEFKITDIFHIGAGFREHILYAPQTEVGEFYHVNGHQASDNHHGRNATRPYDVTAVEDVELSISVLF
jgi:hypothetical protein